MSKFVFPAIWLAAMAVLWIGGGVLIAWLVSAIPDTVLWASRLIRIAAIVVAIATTLGTGFWTLILTLKMAD